MTTSQFSQTVTNMQKRAEFARWAAIQRHLRGGAVWAVASCASSPKHPGLDRLNRDLRRINHAFDAALRALHARRHAESP